MKVQQLRNYGAAGRGTESESEPLAAAEGGTVGGIRSGGDFDIVVVGSGIGATGFIRRLKQFEQTKNLRIAWLEEGTRFSALSWPEALVTGSKEGRIPQFPITSQKYIWALSWKAFGGGDAMNSGGPNYLGLQRGPGGNPVPEIDPPPLPPFANGASPDTGNVYDLRDNSVHPPSPLGDRFVDGFARQPGWREEPVLPATRDESSGVNAVGYPSGLFNLEHTERLFIADDLVPGKPWGVTVLKLACKVKRVLFDEGNKKQACGVLAVDMETGEEIRYSAKKVVLAAGVFGTFDLLLNSGIGRREFLEWRGFGERDMVHVNDKVGTSIGDEIQITVLFLPAERQPPPPPAGQQQPLVGWKTADGKLAAVVWASGLPPLFTIYTRTNLLSWLKSIWICSCVGSCLLRLFSKLVNFLFSPYGFVGVSMDTPAIRHLEIKKDKPERVWYNDDDIQFTGRMLERYNDALPGLQAALDENQKAYGCCGRLWGRFVLYWLTPILRYIIGGRLQEGALTQYNLEPRKLKHELASYQHYYGGCGDDVVDDTYAVIGVQGLHVCDATVITKFGRHLLPGAPSTTIMQQGMRVADAMYPQGS